MAFYWRKLSPPLAHIPWLPCYGSGSRWYPLYQIRKYERGSIRRFPARIRAERRFGWDPVTSSPHRGRRLRFGGAKPKSSAKKWRR